MSTQDIRWLQRFSNFNKALTKLEQAVHFVAANRREEASEDEPAVLSELIQQGLIQAFEFTHELAWSVMKDYALYQGNAQVAGSRDATREAFTMGLITDGEVWMEMIKSRNQTSHTYNEDTANQIFSKIIQNYFPALMSFRNHMETLRSGLQGDVFDS
jgi:nucleotidyltransferase substrate binding protein (TIGR01987 family)